MDIMRWSEVSQEHSSGSAPTIKNHSVTHFGGLLYCFGGYDGRRNHMTLLLYSIAEQRWIRPVHVANTAPPPPLASHGSGSDADSATNSSSGGNISMMHAHHGSTSGSFLGTTGFTVQGTPPPGRNGHSATLASDPEDEENGRIIIIGGWLGTGPLAASDTHVLDLSNGGHTMRWYQPAIKGTPPGPCNMHSADFVRARREVYVFRGGNGREYLNDLHALHVDSLTWRRVETRGAIPQQRANHSSAVLEETGELIVMGGWNGTERLNDIHILNTETSTWTCPHVGGVLPHPRAGMTLTALRGRLYLFGGSGTSAKCFQDLQVLDRKELAWLDVSNYDGSGPHHNGNSNGNRHRMEMSYDHDENRFRFGGSQSFDQGGGMNDMADTEENPFSYFEDAQNASSSRRSTSDSSDLLAGVGGSDACRMTTSYSSLRADWRARDMVPPRQHHADLGGHADGSGGRVPAVMHGCPNPNDEDSVPMVVIHGRGPGRRAGHTATAVGRRIYVFGGSCGSDYLNDFFVLDTDPPPQAIVSEPNSLQLLERRLRHFFNDEEFSDVTFLVQGHRVHGHKMVLSIVSDCFRAMFTAGFRESEAMEIEIPDCSHAAFLAIMEYIYTGNLPHLESANSSNPQDRERALGRVVELLELADRFFLDHLKQICEGLLQSAVNAETIDFLLLVAQKSNASQLQAVCEHFVRNRERSNGVLPPPL